MYSTLPLCLLNASDKSAIFGASLLDLPAALPNDSYCRSYDAPITTVYGPAGPKYGWPSLTPSVHEPT
jgi:hypothetical protein